MNVKNPTCKIRVPMVTCPWRELIEFFSIKNFNTCTKPCTFEIVALHCAFYNESEGSSDSWYIRIRFLPLLLKTLKGMHQQTHPLKIYHRITANSIQSELQHQEWITLCNILYLPRKNMNATCSAAKPMA